MKTNNKLKYTKNSALVYINAEFDIETIRKETFANYTTEVVMDGGLGGIIRVIIPQNIVATLADLSNATVHTIVREAESITFGEPNRVLDRVLLHNEDKVSIIDFNVGTIDEILAFHKKALVKSIPKTTYVGWCESKPTKIEMEWGLISQIEHNKEDNILSLYLK